MLCKCDSSSAVMRGDLIRHIVKLSDIQFIWETGIRLHYLRSSFAKRFVIISPMLSKPLSLRRNIVSSCSLFLKDFSRQMDISTIEKQCFIHAIATKQTLSIIECTNSDLSIILSTMSTFIIANSKYIAVILQCILDTKICIMLDKNCQTPAILVIDCSLCYHTASGTRVPSLGPRGF
jgi:hypothetical protein